MERDPRTRAALIALAFTVVCLMPEGRPQHWVRGLTHSAVQLLDRLALPAVAGHFREGFNDCNYDWRLRCIPDSVRMLRTILLPPAPASTPLMRKVLAGQEPTAEDYAESERMNREFQVRHREFQDKDAAWWRLRAEAQAYRASTWPSLRPFLLGPGAVAHAVRRTFTTDGIGGVVGVALCLVLGTLLVQVIPFGPANLLLIPLAASLVANVLGSGLALIARPLGWQGQSVTFLDPIVRFLRQRPIPHNAP